MTHPRGLWAPADRPPDVSKYELGKHVLRAWAEKKDATDNDTFVRLAAVAGLGTVGDTSDLPLLRTLAEKGVGHDAEATDGLRKAADRAIQAIPAK